MRTVPFRPRRFAFVLAMLALLTVLAALPLLAQSAGAAASSASSRPLSTEQLINQAYSRGEITAEQRILYLAYAVYDISKLPAQYHGTAGWEGTAAVAEINKTLQNQGTGKVTALSPATVAELTRLTRPQGTLCNKPDGPNTTETTDFVINYGDIAGLTIDQYKTGLETAFGVEVTSYDWPKPPFTAENAYGKYPVQVNDASSSDSKLYGYVTIVGGPYTGFIGNNPNTPATETDAWASCMVINNDLVQFTNGDVAKALQALNATTAHEFVHSIQFGVGYPSQTVEGMWTESTATYAEDEVYPDSHDNYGYLWPLFQQSLATYPKAGWYSNWPMFRYASEQNGGLNTPGGGEVVYKDFLAFVAAGQAAIPAYDNALKAKGSNLNDLFHNFAIAIRFTKKCPVADPYCFSDGDGIAAYMSGSPIVNDGELTAGSPTYIGVISDTYSINYIGLPTSGAYNVDMVNATSNGALRASVVADTGDDLQVFPLSKIAGPGENASLAGFTPPAGTQSIVLVITNQGQSSDGSVSLTGYGVVLSAPGESATATPTPTETETVEATETPTPTETLGLPSQTGTPTPTASLTPVVTATRTPTPTATTGLPAATATRTPTPTATTGLPAATATRTPTPTATSGTPGVAYTHFAYLPLVGKAYSFDEEPGKAQR
ncbi:MAG: hypothetical protein U0822_13150 [Anaerolineae bacterium]